jgi:hypothetical protein
VEEDQIQKHASQLCQISPTLVGQPPQYQKNDIYLSGDSAMGQLFPTMYHHAVLSKPALLPRVKGFLLDSADFRTRNVEPKFLIYSKMFHLNTKKDEKR